MFTFLRRWIGLTLQFAEAMGGYDDIDTSAYETSAGGAVSNPESAGPEPVVEQEAPAYGDEDAAMRELEESYGYKPNQPEATPAEEPAREDSEPTSQAEPEVEIDGQKISMKDLTAMHRNYRRLQREYTQVNQQLSALRKGGNEPSTEQPTDPSIKVEIPEGLDADLAQVIEVTTQNIMRQMSPLMDMVKQQQAAERQAELDSNIQTWNDDLDGIAKAFKVNPDTLFRHAMRHGAFDVDDLKGLARDLAKTSKPVFTPKPTTPAAKPRQARPLHNRPYHRDTLSLTDPRFIEEVENYAKGRT